ncbi:hypothetical protein ACVWW5_008050 [Bradyrhizobium sp. LM3.4]
MKELCTRYLADLQAGLILGKGGRTKKASTIVTDTGRIERHIIPLIGTRRVKDLTKTDINKVLKDIMAGKTRVSVKTKKLLKRSRHRLPSSIPSQYLRGHTEGPEERPTHALAVSKTHFLRHDINRVPPFLHHEPGRFQPKPFHCFCRRLPRLGQKGAAELARTEVGDRRKVLDCERIPQILADIRDDQLDAIGFRCHVDERGMLRLSTHTTLIDDHKFGSSLRNFGTQVPIDHR